LLACLLHEPRDPNIGEASFLGPIKSAPMPNSEWHQS